MAQRFLALARTFILIMVASVMIANPFTTSPFGSANVYAYELDVSTSPNMSSLVGSIFEGEWTTIGHPELGKNFSRFRILDVNGKSIHLEYTYKTQDPVSASFPLLEGNKIRFGVFDTNKNSSETTLLISADARTLLATRHTMHEGKEYFSKALMSRVDQQESAETSTDDN